MARKYPRHATPRDLRNAKAAGKKYALDQLDSDYFRDWVRDQLIEASRMDPEDVLPLETKQDAEQIAHNMLKQLEWDTKRDLRSDDLERLIGSREHDAGIAFYAGFRKALDDANGWLADELLQIKSEMGEGHRQVSEAKRKRTGTPVRYKNDLFEVSAWDGYWKTKDMLYGHASGKEKAVFWTHDEARTFAEQFMARHKPLSRDASVRVSETTRSGDTTWHELWIGSSDGKTWEFAGMGRYADKRSGPRMAEKAQTHEAARRSKSSVLQELILEFVRKNPGTTEAEVYRFILTQDVPGKLHGPYFTGKAIGQLQAAGKIRIEEPPEPPWELKKLWPI